MNRKLLWKFLLIIATGAVALFYITGYLASLTESNMSLLDETHRNELTGWGRTAEKLYYADDSTALKAWLNKLQKKEKTQASIVEYSFNLVAGDIVNKDYYTQYNYGRNVKWPIHLDFMPKPMMEVPFEHGQVSFLIILPDRMVPGSYLSSIRLLLQILIPLVIMALIATLLYRHIMHPLKQLELATQKFSQGDFSVSAQKFMGDRNDELSSLAKSFDYMAGRVGQQILSQRQLIADLSHELRTPLTRLDVAVNGVLSASNVDKNIQRIEKESQNIRKLVDDSLTLAWLDNEEPLLAKEDLDLVDLLDVIISDAEFEFPNKNILASLPDTALLKQSNHLAVGQALENILRNAMRYTPEGESATLSLHATDSHYTVIIKDKGPGVPDHLLETIFQPFFRVDQSRHGVSNSFGLGLSLAMRQLHAIGGDVKAENRLEHGLKVTVTLPKDGVVI